MMGKRRIGAVILMVLGGLLMFLAPDEEAWVGKALLGAGAAIELVGIALERKRVP
ncbi:MAG: hypothetical protein K8F27_04155 [Sulfuricellaceae bacterium]|nr:hypothetical protein [Sulfuricellaceae bacterium]